MPIDLRSAQQYALKRLEHELSPGLTYHSIAHTRDDVVPAAARLAELEGITGQDRLLLLTAAYFHDIGFIERYNDNEVIAVRIASEVLPGFGYSSAQIETISGIIMTTHLPQTPHNLLEQIMADADLDVLGRPDYLERNRSLRGEWTTLLGQVSDDAQWYKDQVAFLEGHCYFTYAAHTLRDVGKARNLECVRAILSSL